MRPMFLREVLNPKDGDSWAVLALFSRLLYRPRMPDPDLVPADPNHLLADLSRALTRGSALARAQSADVLAKVVAERLVASLTAAGYVIMRKPPIGGSAPLNPPPSYPHTRPEDMK
jgi:hypothetical protein